MEKKCANCIGGSYCSLNNDHRDVEVTISEAWAHFPREMNFLSDCFIDKEDEIRAAKYVMNCIGCACNRSLDVCNYSSGDYCENFEAMVE